jgi:hypothetical protein
VRPRPPLTGPLVGLFAGLLLGTACSGGGAAPDDAGGRSASPPASPPASPAPSIRTIPALPAVTRPPTGEVTASVQQTSLDVAAEQLVVLVSNDTARALDPTSVRFRDLRLGAALPGGSLREIPSQGERGYPVALPEEPPCSGPRRQRPAYVVVRHEGGRERIRAEDPTDVVGRFLAARCQELALAEAVRLAWAAEVPVDRPGAGSAGVLTLVVTPSGAPGREVTITGVDESFLLGSATGPRGWSPDLTVASDGEPAEVRLPVAPSRCDSHAFLEGGGATAFRVRFTLDGAPGEVLVRMPPAGAAAAIAFALESCGIE